MPLLARTIALQCMYNWARDVFKNPAGHEHDLLMICCITKTMMGWNLNNVAVTCRERCGGMGYLSVSRFTDYIAIAHASMTAEGDNRVLMTKIVKDMLTNVKKHGHKVPQPAQSKSQLGLLKDVSSLNVILDLLKVREAGLFHALVAKMGSLAKSGKSQFEILMRETSDTIQNLAMAYGERRTMEASLATLRKIKNEENVRVMTTVLRVFGLDCIKQNLGFYLVQGVVSREAAANLISLQNVLIKEVAANVDPLINSLSVPHDVLYVPIAQDYEKYYSEANYGEVVGARL